MPIFWNLSSAEYFQRVEMVKDKLIYACMKNGSYPESY